MSLEYRIERHGGSITVVPEGDISLETVDVLREVLRGIVDSQPGVDIEVDMRSVAFLDSSGIGVLVAAQRAAASRGATLFLTQPAPTVRMVLEIAHLGTVLVRDPAVG